jgi:hypothetical protein
LTDGAIPKSSGKNLVATGIGIGDISVPTNATLLGLESERTFLAVKGAILLLKSIISS